jgi:hypothetical protein
MCEAMASVITSVLAAALPAVDKVEIADTELTCEDRLSRCVRR